MPFVKVFKSFVTRIQTLDMSRNDIDDNTVIELTEALGVNLFQQDGCLEFS
jgi:hypothetical protein